VKRDVVEESNRVAEEVARYGLSFRIVEECDVTEDRTVVRVDVFTGKKQHGMVSLRLVNGNVAFTPLEVSKMLRKFVESIEGER